MAAASNQESKTGSFADQVRFLRNWAAKPLTTGAVSPSGRALTRLMASFVDPADPKPVIELGPGTGVVTEALLERGVPPKRIVSIEYNPDFCKLLRHRFADVRFIEGDAYTLNATLGRSIEGDFDAVISSLPLFTRPPEMRHALITDALARLPIGRPFIQFSYALVPPVPAEPGRFTVEHTPWVLMNLPPARVWLYRKTA